jgi:hypothetical protein
LLVSSSVLLFAVCCLSRWWWWWWWWWWFSFTMTQEKIKVGSLGAFERGKSYGTHCLILHSSPFTIHLPTSQHTPHTRWHKCTIPTHSPPLSIIIQIVKQTDFFSFFAFRF